MQINHIVCIQRQGLQNRTITLLQRNSLGLFQLGLFVLKCIQYLSSIGVDNRFRLTCDRSNLSTRLFVIPKDAVPVVPFIRTVAPGRKVVGAGVDPKGLHTGTSQISPEIASAFISANQSINR